MAATKTEASLGGEWAVGGGLAPANIRESGAKGASNTEDVS